MDGIAPGEPGRLQLAGAVAALASEIGDSELALGLWSVVAEDVADPDERVRAAVAAAREAFELGKGDEARAWLGRCRSAGRLPPEVSIAADLVEASVANWLDYRLAERRRWRLIRRALTAARRLASSAGGSGALSPAAQRVYTDALDFAWVVALQREDWRTLWRVGEEMREATKGTDAAVRALIFVAKGHRNVGRYLDSVALFERAWNEARERLLPAMAVDAGFYLATTLADTGRLEQTDVVAREVADLAERVGDQTHIRGRSRSIRHEIDLPAVTGSPGASGSSPPPRA